MKVTSKELVPNTKVVASIKQTKMNKAPLVFHNLSPDDDNSNNNGRPNWSYQMGEKA